MLAMLAGVSWLVWAVQGAMTLWMLVDAAVSSANPYWFFLIFFFQPFGTWIYFFAVKLQDFMGAGRGPRLARPVPLEQLRYNLRSNPCVANKLALANRLLEKNELDEARDLYGQVLKFDDTQKEALFGMGRTQIRQDQLRQGLESLQALVKLDGSYRDYQAAELLATTQWKLGYQKEAIEALDHLVRVHPRFTLMTTLARFLSEAGRKDEARTLINKALDDFRHSPRYVKRMNRKWPKEAKALLGQL